MEGESRWMWLYRAVDIGRVLVFAVAYALVATIVLSLFAANGVVSIVWPPSGMAVAALLLGGRRYAVGIWLGACAANLLAGMPLVVAGIMALVNALEALIAVWLLVSGPGFDCALGRLRDLVRLLLLGAFAASAIAALMGSTILLAVGLIGAHDWLTNLTHWWMGDVLGIVLIAPLLLVWRRLPAWQESRQLVEAALLLGLVVLFGQVVFLGWFAAELGVLARGYWFFLLNIVAAVRLGRHGVLVLLIAVAIQGLCGVVLNVGFLAGATMPLRLTTYWGYLLVLCIEGLVLTTYIEGMTRTRNALQLSENNLHRAQAVAQIGSWALDVRRNILTWTPESYRLFGVAPGTPLTYEVFLACTHPDDRAYVHERWVAALRGEPYDIEHRIVAAGEVRWVNERAELQFDSDGKLIGGIGITWDITERRNAATKLEAHRHQLEDEVALRTAELVTAKDESERANNAKSRFLAAASHDLRQPLSALSVYVGVLGNKLAATDSQLVANLRNCVANLSELLSNLLDLSKLESGVVTPNDSDFALDAILTKVVSSHTPDANLKGLELRCGHFGLIGHTDPVLFQRIIGNLVANAVRYTEKGGVLIGCRRQRGKMWVEVWDTGIGIPSDKTTEIFEEFRQLGNRERDRTKGSGLGLAIVAKTAALLGLQVQVRSRPGKGSVFAVELPLGEAPTKPLGEHVFVQRPLRIALVEDNAAVATALVYALTTVGHQVISAASGSEVLPLLDGIPPDIMISDYRLAGESDGFSVIGALRTRFGDTLPAIIITGDTDPAIIRSMAEHHISVQHKPLDLESLQERIAELTT